LGQVRRAQRGLQHPGDLCEIFPPDDFPLYFYRQPKAPDLELTASNIPIRAVRAARIFWFSVTGLSAEPSRSAHHFALDLRKGSKWTIADLDYRPMFWQDEEIASREVGRALGKANVAIGNKEECRIAVGETEPDRAADALLDRGVDIAVVKQGPLGTLAKTRQERIVMPVTPVEVCNGLGAGDAFGGSFCHALLAGLDLARAVQYASTAGAIVASRLECSTAMPTTTEIERVIAEHPDIRPVIEKR
ncbi:MAG: PfkB family carbohydrate kinase, partial [Propionibacterium acidifaciens]|uniref:PfkB family carbohydrate kinase n=1 Tax=Propionibacterium acidifaciens TaxID=556499 RepID=UPI00361496A8